MTWTAPDLRTVADLDGLVAILLERLPELWRASRQYEQVSLLPFGPSVRPDGSRTRVQRIAVPDATAFTVENPDHPREGVELSLTFLNEADGTIGAVTFGSEYSLDGAFLPPEVDSHATYTFYRAPDGKWREVSRGAGTPGTSPTAPTASFTTSKSGRTVSVINSSTAVAPATLVAWAWTWGDGTTSTLQNPPSHTYAANGTYTIGLTVTDSVGNSAHTDRVVTVSAAVASGLPWGLSNWFATTSTVQTTPNGGTDSFNLAHDSVSPSTIIGRLDACVALGLDTMLNLTGGAHDLNFAPGGSSFDLPTWKARMNAYNTAPIKAAVAAAVARAKGTGKALGNSVIDEPNNATWGPTGSLTKPILDEMARYGKAIFPTLPMGVVSRYDWYQSVHYTDIEFVLHQYSFRLPTDDPGNCALWLSRAKAQDAADGVATVSGVNYSGGFQVPEMPKMTAAGPSGTGISTINLTAGITKNIQAGTVLVFEPGDKKATLNTKATAGNSALNVVTPHDAIATGDVLDVTDCPQTMTLGHGSSWPPNCRMTAKQLVDYMTIIAPQCVGARIWWFNSAWLDLAEIRIALGQVRTIMDSYSMPATGWHRP